MMVQKRRRYSHLLDPTGESVDGGFESSIGDADTSYARRTYRTAPHQLRKNHLYYNNNEQRHSDFYDGPPPQRRPGSKYYRNQPPPLEDEEEEEYSEVIDLGSPRLPRHIIRSEESDSNLEAKNERANKVKFNYKPNPRLYPGPQRKPQRKHRGHSRGDSVSKTSSPSTGQKRRKSAKKRRQVIRRFVPNPRLYRPPPKRIIPPSSPPKQWTPPHSNSPIDLDTASKVALQLAEKAEQQANRTVIYDRNAFNCIQEKGKFVCNKPDRTESAKRQITNKKKETAKEQWEIIYNKNTYDAPEKPMTTYKLSQKNVKFKMNVPGQALESGAPPEVLTEFLAAIMRGEYGVALQYCRMILKFEPQNATAQSFYPLLHQKIKERKALSGSDDSTATVMRANLHPEGYAPRGHNDRCLDLNYSENDRVLDLNYSGPSSASLSSTGTPLSRPSARNWPKSPTISVVSSRKFEAPTPPLKNTSKVSFSEDMANISPSRTPSLEKMRSMFTHSLINSTDITPHL